MGGDEKLINQLLTNNNFNRKERELMEKRRIVTVIVRWTLIIIIAALIFAHRSFMGWDTKQFILEMVVGIIFGTLCGRYLARAFFGIRIAFTINTPGNGFYAMVTIISAAIAGGILYAEIHIGTLGVIVATATSLFVSIELLFTEMRYCNQIITWLTGLDVSLNPKTEGR